MGTRTLRRVMRRANVDATAALNPTPGRAMMSKSIELGLPGVGALLLAVLLAGCAGAPNHSRRLWPSPFPPPQQGPKPRLNRRLNQRPRSWGPLASCGNASRGCSWRWPLGLRQRKPVPNAGAWLLAAGVPLASPCSYSPPQTEGKRLDAGWEFASVRAGDR